jgi:imidazolonepropionase-like amidohydrolase
MRNIGFALLLAFLSCSTPSIQKFDHIISNVNLIDGTGQAMQIGVNVYVKDGVIRKIDSAPRESEKENVIDGTGKYLIPGLFDCHVHTTDYGNDFPNLIHYGVTSVFIPGGSLCTNEYYAEMRTIGSQDSIPAPRVFHTSQHFTMEGRHPAKTYKSPNWRDGISIFYLRDTAQITELVKKVAQYPVLGIKLTIEDGPTPPFVERIPQEFINKTVNEAKKYGLEVFAHASDNTEFLMAVKGGVQNIIHFVGIDIDWYKPEHLDAVEALLDRDASFVTTLMIDKSFIYPLFGEWMENPELNEVYPLENLQKMINPGIIQRARIYEQILKSEFGIDTLTIPKIFNQQTEDIQKLLDKGMNMVLGTDAGNNFNLHGYSLHEEMQILETGGIDPLTIIKMGSLNAARMMHSDDSLGSIEPGKYADMVLLNENPLEDISNTLKIDLVFKNGKIQRRINQSTL